MKAIMRENEKMICSNSSWMGHLPIDWQMPKLLYVLREKISDGPHETPEYVDNGIPFISIDSLNDTKSINLQDCKRYITEEDYIRFSQKTRIEKDDILFSKAATIGKTAIIKDEKIMVWSPLAIIKANSNMINNNYLYHVLNCDKLIIDVSLSGSMNTQINVGMRELEHVKIPLPPFKEQQLIANYLDDRCSKIDAIIAEAKASIEEYKELKQAVIYEAVTKGLDKNVEMKDSGIEWIGKTPLDWQIIRVKHLLTEVNNRSEQGLEEPLSVSQVLGIVPSSEISVANPTSSYIGQKVVEQHDMVFNRLKAHLGVFFESGYKGLVSPDYAVFRGNERINPKFLEYLFHTPAAITEFKKYITGVGDGLRRLYTGDLFNISVSIPRIEKQNEIISKLNSTVKKIDVLVQEKQSLIEDLESYKKSLIYEVVTGKRKVVE